MMELSPARHRIASEREVHTLSSRTTVHVWALYRSVFGFEYRTGAKEIKGNLFSFLVSLLHRCFTLRPFRALDGGDHLLCMINHHRLVSWVNLAAEPSLTQRAKCRKFRSSYCAQCLPLICPEPVWSLTSTLGTEGDLETSRGAHPNERHGKR
jgi:hypothetical protein